MTLQHISDLYPNVISITKIRQDIDALMDLLDKYPEVNVLRGQEVVFKVVRPQSRSNKKQEMQDAVEFMKQITKKYSSIKNKESASEWLIRERDRMRTRKYHDDRNR